MLKRLIGNKRRLFAFLTVLFLIITGSAFAATTGNGTVSVNSGSSATGGGAADITPLSDSFTVIDGNSQKIAGLRLCRIDLGSATFNNKIKIYVTVLDAQNISGVLGNPNSWIEAEVTYEVSSGQNYTLSDGKKVKIATLQEGVDNHLTNRNADILFLPTMGGDSIDADTYYVLGSITVPGGTPPGQQSHLANLTFNCRARL